MNGTGISVAKINKRYGTDTNSNEKVMKNTDKSVWHKYSGKPPHGKSQKFDSKRLGESTEERVSSEKVKKNNLNEPEMDDSFQNKSDTDPYVSVGGTLSDGLKTMKMFPILNSYQVLNSKNRLYFWKIHLEELGGKYVIIDKQSEEFDSQMEIIEDKDVIKKIEIDP